MTKTQPQWQVVDADGDVVVSAGAIRATAMLTRSTPKKVAQDTARDLVNLDAGDAPVFAVPA